MTYLERLASEIASLEASNPNAVRLEALRRFYASELVMLNQHDDGPPCDMSRVYRDELPAA